MILGIIALILVICEILFIAVAFLVFLLFPRKEGKPGSRGDSARVPVAQASPCAPRKGRAVAALEAARRRAERMRHVLAANRRCTVTFRGNHLHIAHRQVRSPQDRILGKRKACRKRSRQRRRLHHLEADVRLARGRGGGETPPAPNTADF